MLGVEGGGGRLKRLGKRSVLSERKTNYNCSFILYDLYDLHENEIYLDRLEKIIETWVVKTVQPVHVHHLCSLQIH